MSNAWVFCPGFPDSRRHELEAVTSFDEIIELMVRRIRDVEVTADPGRDLGLEGCLRPVLTFAAPGTFDAFFNSAAGYRGQFWQDPDQGQAANGRLIRSLMEALLAAIAAADLPRLRSINLEASLRAASAKIWVNEEDFPLESPTRDLAVEPWASAAKRGVKDAKHGICAPANARISVFGAFLDSHGHERVHRDKIRRRFHIHEYGFS